MTSWLSAAGKNQARTTLRKRMVAPGLLPKHLFAWLVAAGIAGAGSAVAAQTLPTTPGQHGRPAAPASQRQGAPVATSGPASASSGSTSPTVEHNLTRLGEVMGSLAWLRGLCGAGDASAWRERMSSLVEAESVLPERKERLADAYNNGYRAYSLTYKRCTPSAELAIQRYLREGATLTRALSSRIAR